MKKFFCTLLILAAITSSTQAQSLWSLSPIKFGVKAGINLTDVNVKNVASNVFGADAQTGYHIGLQSQIAIGPLFIQPELLFSSNKVEYSLYETGDHQYETVNINTIDVPIMVGYKLGLLRLGVGLNFTLYDNKDGSLFNTSSALSKESVSSFILGGGVNLGSITIDARYLRNINSQTQTIVMSDQTINPSVSRSSYQLSLGYLF